MSGLEVKSMDQDLYPMNWNIPFRIIFTARRLKKIGSSMLEDILNFVEFRFFKKVSLHYLTSGTYFFFR